MGAVISQKQVKPGVVSEPKAEVSVSGKEGASRQQVAAPAVGENIPAKIEAAKIEAKKDLKIEFQKGMTYVAWTGNGYSNARSAASMEQLASTGTQWVSLITSRYQDHHNTTEIYPLEDKTPTDESLIFVIRKLHELNLKVMLKPHIDIVEGNGKWRGEISFDNTQDWQTWFNNYSAYILHYADIARQENVESFCVGTELTQSALTQPQLWRDLINKIREVYKGELTYAANWDTEFEKITFWDALDWPLLQ